LKENLISMNGSDGFRFAPHDSEWIGQEVVVRHQAIEGGHVVLLESVAPFDFDLSDFLFAGDYW
jgi:hypothetical protein